MPEEQRPETRDAATETKKTTRYPGEFFSEYRVCMCLPRRISSGTGQSSHLPGKTTRDQHQESCCSPDQGEDSRSGFKGFCAKTLETAGIELRIKKLQ
ncbi:hypothetical protein KQX54_011662 [Cotesia glomerata]|uniref:Uncharacterized protein n=1 Tax=Cotesia glomerata TaxID=32391 RepID=A0AAV7J5L7_COTGL|nr:hypothetical protein KQX54_011662 [Cotesia glomerata]